MWSQTQDGLIHEAASCLDYRVYLLALVDFGSGKTPNCTFQFVLCFVESRRPSRCSSGLFLSNQWQEIWGLLVAMLVTGSVKPKPLTSSALGIELYRNQNRCESSYGICSSVGGDNMPSDKNKATWDQYKIYNHKSIRGKRQTKLCERIERPVHGRVLFVTGCFGRSLRAYHTVGAFSFIVVDKIQWILLGLSSRTTFSPYLPRSFL